MHIDRVSKWLAIFLILDAVLGIGRLIIHRDGPQEAPVGLEGYPCIGNAKERAGA